jgi:DNA-directed RNA polymerase specialized sigma24 family protein
VPVFPEADLEALAAAVVPRLNLPRGPFLDTLVQRALRRWPPVQEIEDPVAPEGSDEPPPPPTLVPLDSLPGGPAAAAEFVTAQLQTAMAPNEEADLFPMVYAVAVHQDGQAFEKLMGTLDSLIRLKGILYRHGLDPDQEYPGLWGRIWEAIPKWDGRDFRAYIARIVRNHCLDEIARKKKAPRVIEDEPKDARPNVRAASTAASNDAMSFVMDVLGELESSGKIKALDHAILEMTREGRAVADILEGFNTGPVPDRLVACLELLGAPNGRARDQDAAIVQLLAKGVDARRIAALSGRKVGELAGAAAALGDLDEDHVLLLRCLARPGISTTDLKRAKGLNANALNLVLNRIRLKLWMAVCERAFESLERRGRLDAVDRAIQEHRCTYQNPGGCRMYKDRECKREAAPEEIARKGGLDLAAAAVGRRMDELRRKVVEEGLGMAFPDYNACMTERKPPPAAAKDAKSKKKAAPSGDDAEDDAS